MTNTQAGMRITVNDLYNGTNYTPRPGLEYELADGVYAVMLKPTIQRVKDFDAVSYRFAKLTDNEDNLDEVINPESEAYFMNALVERVVICCQLPDHANTPEKLVALDGLTSKILRTIVNDFATLK